LEHDIASEVESPLLATVGSFLQQLVELAGDSDGNALWDWIGSKDSVANVILTEMGILIQLLATHWWLIRYIDFGFNAWKRELLSKSLVLERFLGEGVLVIRCIDLATVWNVGGLASKKEETTTLLDHLSALTLARTFAKVKVDTSSLFLFAFSETSVACHLIKGLFARVWEGIGSIECLRDLFGQILLIEVGSRHDGILHIRLAKLGLSIPLLASEGLWLRRDFRG